VPVCDDLFAALPDWCSRRRSGTKPKEDIVFRWTSRPVVLIVLMVFCASTFAIPGIARAGWRDNSDELPGMESKSMTGYHVAGAVLVVALVAILVFKYRNKKATAATSFELNRHELAPQEYAFGTVSGGVARGLVAGFSGATSLESADPSPTPGAHRSFAVGVETPVATVARLDRAAVLVPGDV
jgi:hypothetical protein